MSDKADKLGLFDDSMITEFLLSSDSSLRYAVSRISAECELLIDKRDKGRSNAETSSDGIKRNVDSIIAMCCRIMQVSEMYGFLSALTETEDAASVVCASLYVSELAEHCSESLGGKCEFIYNCAEDFYFEVPENLLTFALLSFVRNRISAGTAKFRIECGTNENNYISVTAESGRAAEYNGDFISANYSEIVKMFVNRCADSYDITGNRLIIYFNSITPADSFEFNASIQRYSSGSFSIYNVLLKDLDEENFM